MPDSDPNTPSIARVYDYVLGGEDNFAADRALAERLLTFVPTFGELAIENRAFLARAVSWAAGEGISQFIDLGSGLPTAPSTHESARAIHGDARVVYVDNDPAVASYASALPSGGLPGVRFVHCDVRDVAGVLDIARAELDLAAPACLIAGFLLHFLPADDAREMMAGYSAALAPGSFLVLSVLQADGSDAEAGAGMDMYSSRARVPVFNHPVSEIASFFGPVELVPPGLVAARWWVAGGGVPESAVLRGSHVLGGVGRTPEEH